MKSELTLEILGAYLPWKVQGISNHGTVFDLDLFNSMGGGVQKRDAYSFLNGQFKLLLRPMEDLTKPLPELEGKSTMEAICDKLNNLGYSWPKVKLEADFEVNEPGIYLHNYGNSIQVQCVPDYYMIPLEAFEAIRSLLLSLHFDIYGGIESGWALNVNEI